MKKSSVKKLDYLFNDYESKRVPVPQNTFSMGMEVEFCCPTPWFNYKYNRNISDYDSYYLVFESTLGFDGSGPETKEYRSPVFTSNNPETCFEQMEVYSKEVQEYVVAEFNAKFAPYYHRKPLGIHFSLGGKFLSSYSDNIIKRARKIQPELINYLPLTGESRTLFNLRENRYPGQFNSSIIDFDSLKNARYCNAIKFQFDRIEFRFLPSANLNTIFPIIAFVLFNEPINENHKIKFIL